MAGMNEAEKKKYLSKKRKAEKKQAAAAGTPASDAGDGESSNKGAAEGICGSGSGMPLLCMWADWCRRVAPAPLPGGSKAPLLRDFGNKGEGYAKVRAAAVAA